LREFSAFLGENDLLRKNFQNSVPKVFIATPIEVVLFKICEIWPTEIGEIVHYLPDKKTQFRLPLKLLLLRGLHPKSVRATP